MYAWLQRLFSSGDKRQQEEEEERARLAQQEELQAKALAARREVLAETAPAKPVKPAATPSSSSATSPATSPAAASAASSATAPPAQAPAAKGKTQDNWGPSWEQRNDAGANFNDWLFANSDNTEFEVTPIENEVLEALDKIVKGKQSGANLVKRMPGVIPQLLQSLRTENFSGAELSRKISHDVVLVAAVIRLANSSLYNPSQNITSIEHAILILGHNGLRQLITGVAFRPIIDLHSGHYTKSIAPRVWEQSEYCAIACRLLAEEKGVDPFDAFLAGLIQHVGLVVALRIIDQTCQGNPHPQIGSAPFFSALLRHTRTLSCSIAREWNFPESVSQSIEEQGSFNTANMSDAAKVLALGDYLSKVHMLVANNRLTEGDTRVLKGLTPHAVQCYRDLAEVEVFDPLAEGKA